MTVNIVVANSNLVHEHLERYMAAKYQVVRINKKEELTKAKLDEISPDYIFFPHWSFIIPPEIFQNFECIVFHMTDLPFGRGGSPLQNLIVQGYSETKLSAIRVAEGIDTGDVYLKKTISLLGSAEEIFLRMGDTMKAMIEEIITGRLVPKPQEGEVVQFKRRKPEEGNIMELDSLQKVYDFIRMLDAEGYPSAFLETEHLKLEFSRASLKKDRIIADVRIFKK